MNSQIVFVAVVNKTNAKQVFGLVIDSGNHFLQTVAKGKTFPG
jgi:hypothetical protein